MSGRLFHHHPAIALSVACALALPLAAKAQSRTHDQQLEQRVSQLEQQLPELQQTEQAQAAESATIAVVPDASATPPVFVSAPGGSMVLHGFVSATALRQNKTFAFGNGQNADWPVPGSSGSLIGVDVRNTRCWLDFSGAKFAGKWTGGGCIDKDWLAYFAAHCSRVDLRGVEGNSPIPIKSDVTSVGYEVGGQWKPGPSIFRGLAYSGRGPDEIFGVMAQFGDISESGGNVQVGYSGTPNWSAYAFYASNRSDKHDVIDRLGNGSTGQLRNRQAALSLEYSAGACELGVERKHDRLDCST